MSIFQSSIFDRYILLSNFFYRPIIREIEIEERTLKKKNKKNERKKKKEKLKKIFFYSKAKL